MRNIRSALAATAAVAVVAMAGGCAAAGSQQVTQQRARTTTTLRGQAVREPASSPDPFGISDTAFGTGLLGSWCRARPGANLVFSPSTLASALGLAYLGARGGTAIAMARALRLPETGKGLLAGLRARSHALNAAGGPGATIAASNRVWADPGLTPTRSYLDAAATGYGAGLTQVPLRSDPATAADDINSAISAATHGHIPSLVTPDMLRDDGWVLTAALYLDAKWATPFEPSQTRTGTFLTSAHGGRRVSARFMNGGSFPVATGDGWTGVTLPYRGGKLAMTALLPPASAGACAMPGAGLLKGLTARGPALTTPNPGWAAVSLPKVSLSAAGSMKAELTALGMGQAFGPSADFSGLSPKASSLTSVQQAATLQVGEKGTVGSAASSVGIAAGAEPASPRTVTFNRPYLMLVSDPATGEPLFLARVADPGA